MITNIIYNEDCLVGMKRIPDKSIDMILCDLPYAITQNKWDVAINLDLLWAEYTRIIKSNGAIVLTAQTPFDKVLGASNIAWLKYEWIWVKNISTGYLHANKMPLKQHENILVFYKDLPVYNPQMKVGTPYIAKRKPINDNGSNYGKIVRTDTVNKGDRFPTSVIECDREVGLHPTQKPAALFEYLIRTYTNEKDLVLDNCMGSGTTAIACINANRRYLGFETENIYYNVALNRISKFRMNKEKAERAEKSVSLL